MKSGVDEFLTLKIAFFVKIPMQEAQDNRKTQSKFKCMACGHADHADLNAAAIYRPPGLGLLYSERRSGCRPLRPVKWIRGWPPNDGESRIYIRPK